MKDKEVSLHNLSKHYKSVNEININSFGCDILKKFEKYFYEHHHADLIADVVMKAVKRGDEDIEFDFQVDYNTFFILGFREVDLCNTTRSEEIKCSKEEFHSSPALLECAIFDSCKKNAVPSYGLFLINKILNTYHYKYGCFCEVSLGRDGGALFRINVKIYWDKNYKNIAKIVHDVLIWVLLLSLAYCIGVWFINVSLSFKIITFVGSLILDMISSFAIYTSESILYKNYENMFINKNKSIRVDV